MPEETWEERSKYLHDKWWTAKELLPLDVGRFGIVKPQYNTEMVYDFEVQNNIYSISVFYRDEHKLVIYYYTNPNTHIDKEAVIKKAYQINGDTIKTYQNDLSGLINFYVEPLTPKIMRQLFERPNHYVIGFNSNYYDLPVASYILAYIYKHGGDLMPTPHEMREWNNLLIKTVDTVEGNLTYRKELWQRGYKPMNRMPLYQLSSIFDYAPRYIMQKRGFFQGLHGTVPYINQIYRRLQNTGLHLDMKLLNEKDKDDKASSGIYTSLKRIAAQLGFQIEEPDEVNLASNGNLTEEQCVNLLAYNASDVLVTTLIFKSKDISGDYQDVLSNREGLINRFDETNFKGHLNVDSTSAQAVELVIAPEEKDRLVDQDSIDFFYPIHGKKYEHVQKIISSYYDHKKVHYMPIQARKDLFKNWLEETGQNVPHDRIDFLKLFDDPNENSVRWKFEQWFKKRWDNSEQSKDEQGNYIADRDYLDYWLTIELQKEDGFGPVQDEKGNWHQLYRVKYGELEQDVLEHNRIKFKGLFPPEVYDLYSFYRGTYSIYEGKTLVKAARSVALERYVNHYTKIYGYKPLSSTDKEKGLKPKPQPPKNVMYNYRKDNSVKGVYIHVQVPNLPMSLSYSAGGVHGAVIKMKPYLRDKHAAEKFNNVLNKLKETYPDPADFMIDATSDNLKPSVKDLFNLDDNKFKSDLHLFARQKNKKWIYQSEQKMPDPNDKYMIPIDMRNAIHVDVDSLYPSAMINLHLFSRWVTDYHNPDEFSKTNMRGHWYDVYAKLRAERVHLKKTALSVPKEKWTDVQRHQWKIQLLDKLILNSASGIADGAWDTRVRANNRAASMRLMCQLALTYLIYSVAPKGFYSTSTNTDGVYLTSIHEGATEKDIDAEIEHWKERHHLGATPEIMWHFVSKDANNRFEQENAEVAGAPAGGTIGNAFGADAKKKMSQPFIIDAGIVNYFKTHDNICTTYDIPMDDLIAYLKKQQDVILNAKEYDLKVRKAMLSFCWPMQPKKGQNFIFHNGSGIVDTYQRMQHVNRLIMVNHGYNLVSYTIKPVSKAKKKEDREITKWCRENGIIEKTDIKSRAVRNKVSSVDPNWQMIRVNLDLKYYFKSPIWKDLDLQAYAELTQNKILGSKASPIWVERKFDQPAYQEKLNRLIK